MAHTRDQVVQAQEWAKESIRVNEQRLDCCERLGAKFHQYLGEKRPALARMLQKEWHDMHAEMKQLGNELCLVESRFCEWIMNIAKAGSLFPSMSDRHSTDSMKSRAQTPPQKPHLRAMHQWVVLFQQTAHGLSMATWDLQPSRTLGGSKVFLK